MAVSQMPDELRGDEQVDELHPVAHEHRDVPADVDAGRRRASSGRGAGPGRRSSPRGRVRVRSSTAGACGIGRGQVEEASWPRILAGIGRRATP